MALYIGLMSGTSLDGIDAVLVDFAARPLRVLGHHHQVFEPALREQLLALNASSTDEIHRAALAANALSRAYAEATQALLHKSGVATGDLVALGAHGQTVRHRPGEFDGLGYTVQLLNGALLAELSAIDVVCDFRSRDVAAGGQGAPLVPAFHAAAFARPGEALAVLNLGGISNLTLVGSDGAVSGFDVGPANGLMDGWCERHTGAAYDDGGRWAAQGQVEPALLRALQAEPYFHRAPPKSTGRDLFNLAWLDAHLAHVPATSPVDVQATLTELTARSVAADLAQYAPGATRLLVCGGGARNLHLMRRLRQSLPSLSVDTTEAEGLPVDQVEAVAFAWLAQRFVDREAGNCVAVTGARGPRVLGALHPAR